MNFSFLLVFFFYCSVILILRSVFDFTPQHLRNVEPIQRSLWLRNKKQDVQLEASTALCL